MSARAESEDAASELGGLPRAASPEEEESGSFWPCGEPHSRPGHLRVCDGTCKLRQGHHDSHVCGKCGTWW